MYNETLLGGPGVSWISKAQKKMGHKAVAEVDQHCQRVGQICFELGRLSGFGPSQCNRLKWAGFLHDMGKYLVPPEVLFKCDKLSREERKLISSHPSLGAQKYVHFSLGSSGGFDKEIFCAIYQHHERFDGAGYPAGIEGRSIERSAQIVSLGDYIEALTADRCYRPAFPYEEVVEMVEAETGRAWPQSIAGLFLNNQEKCFAALKLPSSLTSDPRGDRNTFCEAASQQLL